MKILLDTNIVIHREGASVINEDIGILFRWLDNLHYSKYVHSVTINEIAKHGDTKVRKAFQIKLDNYNVLKTTPQMAEDVLRLSKDIDRTHQDHNDTIIINEVYCNRVDALITEDQKLRDKASFLSISDKVFSIDEFLEKVNAENPDLADYKVLSVKKSLIGHINLSDPFFNSFREDYPQFDKWFNAKSEDTAYVCVSSGQIMAFLYLKTENKYEDYSDIEPSLTPNKRLKIGSFKIILNGYRLGERFLKIVFDNALRFSVDEIYVTVFNKRIDQTRLISLLQEFGFCLHGVKHGQGGDELVYTRSFQPSVNRSNPKLIYPFFSTQGNIFLVPIYPEYHTELFPDSILRTESPLNFVENEPHRNAISKVYISRSIEKDIKPGDVLIFYRTGGYYKGVVSTIGVAEGVIDNIPSEEDFIRLCRKRSVFSDNELSKQWQYNKRNRPFITNFLYVYSFPKRINLQKLIQLGVIHSIHDVPRGFTRIKTNQFENIMRECAANESIVVN